MGRETSEHPTLGLVDVGNPEGCTANTCSVTVVDGGRVDLDLGRWELVPLEDDKLGIAEPVEVEIVEDETVDATFDYTGPSYESAREMLRLTATDACRPYESYSHGPDERFHTLHCRLRPGLATAFVVRTDGKPITRPPHLIGVYGRNWFVDVKDGRFAARVQDALGGVRVRG
jgi:hypothetical protein